jgi:hypothetical protein
MNTIILSKEAVESLLCAVCLKRKADTIAGVGPLEQGLICKECLEWVCKQIKSNDCLTISKIFEERRVP